MSINARPPDRRGGRISLSFLRSHAARWAALAALLACACGGPDGFRAEKAFADPGSLDGLAWKCRTVFAHARDSGARAGGGALAVTAYAGEYPGMEWNWLEGDWTGYDSLCFSARAEDPAGREFTLSIWDGKEPYEPGNRFAARFRLGPAWERHCLILHGGLRAGNGRGLDPGRVRRVMFFAAGAPLPLAFRLAWVRLLPVSSVGYRK